MESKFIRSVHISLEEYNRLLKYKQTIMEKKVLFKIHGYSDDIVVASDSEAVIELAKRYAELCEFNTQLKNKLLKAIQIQVLTKADCW